MNVEFRVVSDSMTPLIKIQDTLTVDRVAGDLRTFDIIVFKRSSNLVVHYIWKDRLAFNNTLITRSLKNIYTDEEPVYKNELVGLVTNFKMNSLLKFKILILCLLKGAL